jgi:5'-nucleotidase
MLEKPLDLAKARVLITNDDGLHAPGVKLLARLMRPLVRDLWVVTPETEQSAAGHSLTLRRPLRVRKVSARRYAVDGTPTDSVLLGINTVLKEQPPDLVLSGINRGANLGEDVTYSGTVSAAMEATLLGFPAIALSQVYGDHRKVKWATSERHIVDVVRRLLARPWPRHVLMNVNIPNVAPSEVTGVEATRQGRRKIGGALSERLDPRGETYYWIGAQRSRMTYSRGTDLEAVGRGAISVTPLSLELTHGGTLKALRKVLD